MMIIMLIMPVITNDVFTDHGADNDDDHHHCLTGVAAGEVDNRDIKRRRLRPRVTSPCDFG